MGLLFVENVFTFMTPAGYAALIWFFLFFGSRLLPWKAFQHDLWRLSGAVLLFALLTAYVGESWDVLANEHQAFNTEEAQSFNGNKFQDSR